MRRQELWLALCAYSIMGVIFSSMMAHQARLKYAPEIILSLLVVIGLGMIGLAFLGLLKR